jgi:hypothetical protein
VAAIGSDLGFGRWSSCRLSTIGPPERGRGLMYVGSVLVVLLIVIVLVLLLR